MSNNTAIPNGVFIDIKLAQNFIRVGRGAADAIEAIVDSSKTEDEKQLAIWNVLVEFNLAG